MKISLTSYGAAREVTGSRHLLTVGGKRILIDCGFFQGKRKESEAKNREVPFDPASIDAAVLTHGHLDHCGGYPVLGKNGFKAPIFATAPTAEIAGIVMADCAHIQEGDARWLKKKAAKKGLPDPGIEPLYDHEDVPPIVKLMRPVRYGARTEILPGIFLTLTDAGHILGSAMAVFEIGDVRFGFSGDLGRCHMPILRDPQFPGQLDHFVCESTYGNRVHDEFATAENEVAEIVSESWKRGGKVLIPAFAIGRTQEIVWLLHRLVDEGRLPPDIEIWVDSPMGMNVTEVFRKHPECYDEETKQAFTDHHENPFGFSQLRYVKDVMESKALSQSNKPAVVIASSGMCESGRICHHLAAQVGNPATTVMLVGYMAEHTLGRALAEKRPYVRIYGEEYAVKSRLKNMNAFSAHADSRETIDFMEPFDRSRLKNVFLVHGETPALEALREKVGATGVKRVTIVEPRTEYEV